MFVVSNIVPPKFIVDTFAQPDGSVIIKLQQLKDMKFLMDTVSDMHKLGKFADD